MYNTTPPPFSDPNQSPDSKHQKVNSIWKAASMIYIMAVLALTFYWEFNDTGLCIVVREWQGALLTDSYYPALDILGVLLIFFVPLFIVKVIVEKATGVKIDNLKR